jgi:hypothetical protein
MGLHEDFFYHIYNEVHTRGISDEFYKQLDKMKFQDKHKHKTVRDNWEYAYNKIIEKEKNETYQAI